MILLINVFGCINCCIVFLLANLLGSQHNQKDNLIMLLGSKVLGDIIAWPILMISNHVFSHRSIIKGIKKHNSVPEQKRTHGSLSFVVVSELSFFGEKSFVSLRVNWCLYRSPYIDFPRNFNIKALNHTKLGLFTLYFHNDF